MIQQALRDGANDFVTRLKQQQSQRGIRASGRSAASLRVQVSDDGKGYVKAEVYGAGYFLQQEFGRPKTRRKQGGILQRQILKWMGYKGIGAGLDDAEKRSISFAIATKIHQSGTLLWRGRSQPVGIRENAIVVAQKVRPQIRQHANNSIRFAILGEFQDGRI